MANLERELSRRNALLGSFAVAMGLLSLVGCSESAMRLQDPDALELALADVQMVGDVTAPFGGHSMEVESVALVGGLAGTGSDPGPGVPRTMLLSEMQKRDVKNPGRTLASPNTSLVIATGQLPPGTQKGDRFDVEVFVQSDSETISLRNGVMYEARLAEHAVLGGRIREGKIVAHAKGPVLVDPLADVASDPAKLRRGLILGGGIALESRPLGLLIRPEHKDVRLSAQAGQAINKRFHLSHRGIQSGVAKPKTDSYIELTMHPRYKDNIDRFMQVIRSIPLGESPIGRQMRLKLLERQLLDPATAATAAVRLEAIGTAAEDVLKRGVASGNSEVQFYAAEALAYLDNAAAAEPLAAAARNESAFRAFALTALSAMDEPAARDQLIQLLNVTSTETRYGAFRALWAMNPNDPMVRGETMGDEFSFHMVRSQGPPMVHVTRSFRPEIVLFGSNHMLRTPLILDAGKNIRINASGSGQVTVTRFIPGQQDEQREVPPRVDTVIQAIVDLGGSYPDVVQALAQAKAIGSLDCRFEVDAVPKRNRQYYRKETEIAGSLGSDGVQVDSPRGDLYPDRPGKGQGGKIEKAEVDTADREDTEDDPPRSAAAKPPENGSWPLTRHVGRILNRFRN